MALATKRVRKQTCRLALKETDKRPLHSFWIRSTRTYRSFITGSPYMRHVPEGTKFIKFQEYPLAFSGEVCSGVYLGSNAVTANAALEKRVERLVDSFKGDGDLTEHIKGGFISDSSGDDFVSETESENDALPNKKQKAVVQTSYKNATSTPINLKRQEEFRYVAKEIADNETLLGTSMMMDDMLPNLPQQEKSCDNCRQMFGDKLNKIDEIGKKRDSQIKYLATKLRNIERALSTENLQNESFEDEEVRGVNGIFRLSQILSTNPNTFIRNYAKLRFGEQFITSHVFDLETGHRSNRIPVDEEVNQELKGVLKKCYNLENKSFPAIWKKARESLNSKGRELIRLEKKIV